MIKREYPATETSFPSTRMVLYYSPEQLLVAKYLQGVSEVQ